MTILNGSIRHRASSAATASPSTSGTSSSAGASTGIPPRRAINSPKCAPVRVSRIATTLDFICSVFNHAAVRIAVRLRLARLKCSDVDPLNPMLTPSRKVTGLLLALLCAQSVPSANGPPAAPADPAGRRPAFVAAIHRLRLTLPDPSDSPALEAYPLHDYLVAARLRRDLARKPDDAGDAAIDAFLQARAGQPVARGLRRDWLASLAQRRRWDWFLPRSADVSDPALVCDRLEGRLVTGDTAGLGAAVLARWSLPQRPPAESNEEFAWVRLQNLITRRLG